MIASNAIDAASVALSELAERINAEHKAAEAAARSALGHALAAGKLLMEAKAAVNHGEWSAWLADHFEGSERTARAYMRLAKHWRTINAKRQSTADLSIHDALQLLAEPKITERTLRRKVAELQDRLERARTVAEYAAVARDALKLQNQAAEFRLRAERAVGEILNSASGCRRKFLRLVADNPDVDFMPVIDARLAELGAE